MASSPVSPQDAASAVLQAARIAFAARGYAGTTVKSVAVAAGVAPDVVTSLYRNKERLFAAALRLPFDPAGAVPELIAPGVEGLGRRLVLMLLTVMDDERVRDDLSRVLSSEAAAPAAATAAATAASASQLTELRSISEYLSSTVIDPVVTALGVPDARLRVTVITSHLLGLAMSRYVLRIEPLASASEEEVVRLVAPAIQSLLDPTSVGDRA